ncbi:MAG TPA: DUF6036 family nucleotidyltransferase [Polyangia bacterium]|nr:DUF6036 family nucleotidyltransferase [Polyangia bacterium]
MLEAFAALDRILETPTRLIVGGGAAMLLAHGHPLSTHDVDTFAARGGLSPGEIGVAARTVAKDLGIAPDWLNEHFASFAHVLPPDYGARLVPIFHGERLTAEALGAEDLLVMKCFSGRDKDRPHLRRLMRIARDLDIVDRRLRELADKRVPGTERAADIFDDLSDEVGR